MSDYGKSDCPNLGLGWGGNWIGAKSELPVPRKYVGAWHSRENPDINFDFETVYIVEAKSGKDPNLRKAVNQLTKYVELFLEDWKANVEDLILVAENISMEKNDSLHPNINLFLAEQKEF